jgi:hypothetical protein
MDHDKDIRELYEDLYTDEPPVGAWVIVKHNYNETIITGEVVALKHTQPQRGWKEEADFEFVYLEQLQVPDRGYQRLASR